MEELMVNNSEQGEPKKMIKVLIVGSAPIGMAICAHLHDSALTAIAEKCAVAKESISVVDMTIDEAREKYPRPFAQTDSLEERANKRLSELIAPNLAEMKFELTCHNYDFSPERFIEVEKPKKNHKVENRNYNKKFHNGAKPNSKGFRR